MKKHSIFLICLCVVLLLSACSAGTSTVPTVEAVSPSTPEATEPSTTECLHEWVDATCIELSHCTKCGETRGTLKEHDFQGGSCTEPAVCAICGGLRSAAGHDFQGGDCLTPAVCIVCGAEGELGEHNFSQPTCTDAGICSICGAEKEPLGHKMKEATCTMPSTCERCGYTEGEALGHTGPGTCERCGGFTAPKFEVITEPGSIYRGNTATVTICGEPNTTYQITVYVKSGASEADGLESKTSDAAGYVSWSWKVGSRSSGGTYRIVISGCGESRTLEYTILE